MSAFKQQIKTCYHLDQTEHIKLKQPLSLRRGFKNRYLINDDRFGLVEMNTAVVMRSRDRSPQNNTLCVHAHVYFGLGLYM